MTTKENQNPKSQESSKRGFAGMDPEKQKAIASAGGKAAHAMGKAHKYNSKTGAAAGRKSHKLGRAHQFTPEEAAEAGRKGGIAAAEKRARE